LERWPNAHESFGDNAIVERGRVAAAAHDRIRQQEASAGGRENDRFRDVSRETPVRRLTPF